MSAAESLPPSLVYRLPASGVLELLGWNVWSAAASSARVDALRVGDRLEVVLAEDEPADGPDPSGGASRTRLLLGADGRCAAFHTASPSLLHLRHVGVEMGAVARDGARSEVLLAHGDVLVVPTSSFLQVAPAALLAQIPMRARRRRSLAGLADDLVRRVGRGAAGERVGIVVAQRVWPAEA